MNQNIDAEIKKIIGHLHIGAVRNWLKNTGLPHYAKDNDEFMDRLKLWIKNGEISIDDLKNAALEIEENCGKKIYLFNLTGLENFKKKDNYEKYLSEKNIELSGNPNISIWNSPKGVLHYIYMEEGTNPFIKMKFWEIHEDIEIDYETATISSTKKPRFIVALVDLNTGFTQIRFDKPGNRHPHKDNKGRSSETKYINDYIEKIADYTGCSSYSSIDLRPVLRKLTNMDPVIFKINREETTVSNNAKQTYALAPCFDVRHLTERNAAANTNINNWIPEDISGYWLAALSGGKLTKDFFMRISGRFNMISFSRNCLAKELDYAIGKII